jgi:hypothetical protein
MTRMSKVLGLGACAALAVAAAVLIPPTSRAGVTLRPLLNPAFSAADLDAAHRASDEIRSRGRGAAEDACAGHAWPHIPAACQSATDGQGRRPIRTVTVDTITTSR